jgi:hypothetical protein
MVELTEEQGLDGLGATAPGMVRLLLGNRLAVAAGVVVLGF